MAKIKKEYICSNCGAKSLKSMGYCHICKEYGTFEEHIIQEENSVSKSQNSILNKGVDTSVKLKSVKDSALSRIVTGINEFDRVLGGGIVTDSINIITAEPGTGKSTLLLQVCESIAKQGLTVLYATGEESNTQVKNRADRIIDDFSEKIYISSDDKLENVVTSIENIDADFIVIDSISTFYLSDIDAPVGKPKQIMACANLLTRIAKKSTKKRSIMLICQKTKDNELRGPRELEHLVDGVLEMDSQGELKFARCSKNRFGNTGEVGLFEMNDKGLIEIGNPSKYFITERDDDDIVFGSALSVVKEGTRPILLEVESSVTKSFTPYPQRLSEGIKREKLNILVSILEEKAGVNLIDKNVISKISAGLKIDESSVDLSILMSVASSFYRKPIPNKTVFLGEVGLTGEIKKVNSLDSRIKEADRMGFETIYIPNQSLSLDEKSLSIKIKRCKNINDVIDDCLSKGRC